MTLHRAFLEALYDVGIAAAHPRALVEDAIARMYEGGTAPRRVALIALGKAAPSMADTALAQLARYGSTVTGGVVIGSADGPSPHSAVVRAAGDHPVPGVRSRRAASILARAVDRVRGDADTALVLLSGGTTSLVGSPVAGIPDAAITALFDALLRSGWDIGQMNAVRKRFLEWGAGRLAVALAPLAVHPLILSDVIGDDPAVIACGPCTPDPLTAFDVGRRLAPLALNDAARRALTEYLDRVADGELAETPKPGDPVFARVAPPRISSNATAVAAIADHARSVGGWPVTIVSNPLRGEARERGIEIARYLRSRRDERLCVIYSGETTVTLNAGAVGRGGRCQELALAAAQTLDADDEPTASIALMAAGTDGRDGATDAAGAIIDSDTARRARAGGAEPRAALEAHDSHTALAAAGALIPARATGTNVMDIVVGLVDAG